MHPLHEVVEGVLGIFVVIQGPRGFYEELDERLEKARLHVSGSLAKRAVGQGDVEEYLTLL